MLNRKLGRVGAIIQARSRSQRLPGKIFLKLPYAGPFSLVETIVHRVQKLKELAEVVIATSLLVEDAVLGESAAKMGVRFFQGSEDNVLDRMIAAAEQFQLDTFVRLTGDNPFIDPDHISATLAQHISRKADYTYSSGLPLGMNTEIVNVDALRRAKEMPLSKAHQEHVTLYLRENTRLFSVEEISFASVCKEKIRLTVDWPEDYAFACFLFEKLGEKGSDFSLEDIMTVIKKYPWAKDINSAKMQIMPLMSGADELPLAIEWLERNGLPYAASLLKLNLENK